MAGLINDVLDGTGTKKTDVLGTDVLNADTTGYDPATRDVNAGTETAAGQMDTLLKTGSPYLDRARGNAAQAANSRGLLNSSMAAGAGEAAAIDAALPIATHDADTFTTAARDNQQSKNQAFQFNAGESNNNARFNASSGNQVSLLGAQTTAQSRLQAENAAHQESLERVQGQIQSGLSAQQATQQEAISRVQGEINAGLITNQEQANARLAEIQGKIQSGLSAQQAGQQSTLLAQQGSQAQQLEQVRGQVETQLQTLRGGQAQNLANIEATYRTLIQANASASTMYNNAIQMMAGIMADPNTSTEQKQAAVDQVTGFLHSGLTLVGTISNVDISGILDFAKP